jgi:outer membrane lipoprotein-sorting protein
MGFQSMGFKSMGFKSTGFQSMGWHRHEWKLFCAAVAVAGMVFAASAVDPALAAAFAKMDQAALHFKGVSANVSSVQHMDPIHEDDLQSGTMLVKRPHPKELHVRISFEKPDAKVAVYDGKKVEVYYPRSGEIQTVSLGQRRSLVGLVLMLGFGGTSKELQDAYDVTLGGAETVAGESATRLKLLPKSKEMAEQWRQIDLWISDKSGYAVQQKFYEHGKDYTLITYTNVQPKPDIPESMFNLKLEVPKGTKTEPLNKK